MEPYLTPWLLGDLYLAPALLGFVVGAIWAVLNATEDFFNLASAKRGARAAVLAWVWPLVVLWALWVALRWLWRLADFGGEPS